MDIKERSEFYKGMLALKQRENGVVPVRFTAQAMDEYYAVKSEAFRLRAMSPAGIFLDMETDAKAIQIDFDLLGAARPFADFGLVIDGVLQPVTSNPLTQTGLFPDRLVLSNRFSFDGRSHHIELFLPHLVELELRAVELIDASFVKPVPAKRRMLFTFGDSITQGMTVQNPYCTYPVLLARALGMELRNFGVGGGTFHEGVLAAYPHKPDLITVAFGVNDWVTHPSMGQFEKYCRGFFERFHEIYNGIPTYVITPFWHLDERKANAIGTLEELRHKITEICADYDVSDCYQGNQLIPSDPACFADGMIHPNGEGFAHIALQLLSRIKNGGKE